MPENFFWGPPPISISLGSGVEHPDAGLSGPVSPVLGAERRSELQLELADRILDPCRCPLALSCSGCEQAAERPQAAQLKLLLDVTAELS